MLRYFNRKEECGTNMRRERSDYGFVDLFCGIGGASQGAMDAGLSVWLAVDFCGRLLNIHRKNHPDTVHVCAELPFMEGVELPSHCNWHLHGSPPCTALSNMNKIASDADRSHGIGLVKWYLDFAIGSTAGTWSMEQVPVKEVIREVERAMEEHPGKVDYCVKNCYDLGVPQTRKRLFAGSPHLISNLRRRKVAKRVVCDVIANPRGTHTRPEVSKATTNTVRNGEAVQKEWIYGDDDMCRPLDSPCHTITASHGLRWATPGSNTKPFKMHPSELMLLQTFPYTYQLGDCLSFDTRGVGNAVPPKVMTELLKPLSDRGVKDKRVLCEPQSPCFDRNVHEHLSLT